MLASRPDLTDFECPFDRFLMLRTWLTAEQRAAAAPAAAKRGPGKVKAIKVTAKATPPQAVEAVLAF